MYNEEENRLYLKDCIDTWEELPSIREEAKEINSILYKCKYGCRNNHLPVRYTSNGRCAVCVRRSKRKYFINNKESLYKALVRRQVQRYKEDPVFKAGAILRDCIKRVFRDIKSNKDGKTFDLLSYTKEEFMLDISNKFYGEMDWSNHGTVWELDHVIPLAAFDLENPTHRKYLNSLENFQPLLISDHSSKTSVDMKLLAELRSSGQIAVGWEWLINQQP